MGLRKHSELELLIGGLGLLQPLHALFLLKNCMFIAKLRYANKPRLAGEGGAALHGQNGEKCATEVDKRHDD